MKSFPFSQQISLLKMLRPFDTFGIFTLIKLFLFVVLGGNLTLQVAVLKVTNQCCFPKHQRNRSSDAIGPTGFMGNAVRSM